MLQLHEIKCWVSANSLCCFRAIHVPVVESVQTQVLCYQKYCVHSVTACLRKGTYKDNLVWVSLCRGGTVKAGVLPSSAVKEAVSHTKSSIQSKVHLKLPFHLLFLSLITCEDSAEGNSEHIHLIQWKTHYRKMLVRTQSFYSITTLFF